MTRSDEIIARLASIPEAQRTARQQASIDSHMDLRAAERAHDRRVAAEHLADLNG